MLNRHQSAEVRFWLRVNKAGSAECWNWTGTKNEKGYGRILINKTQVFTHRYAYELLVGPIPEGLTLDHKCCNKACVNPMHLEPVGRGENSRRFMLARETCKHGHHWSFENTRYDKRGRRCCRACERARWHSRNTQALAAIAEVKGAGK